MRQSCLPSSRLRNGERKPSKGRRLIFLRNGKMCVMRLYMMAPGSAALHSAMRGSTVVAICHVLRPCVVVSFKFNALHCMAFNQATSGRARMQIQGFELTKVFASPEGARKRASKPHPRRRSKASSAAIPADSLQLSPRTSKARAQHPAASDGSHDAPATATSVAPPARPSTGALSPPQSLASADRASFAAPSPAPAPPEQAAVPTGLEAESRHVRSCGEGEEPLVVHERDNQTHESSELSPLPVWGGRRQRPGVAAAVGVQCAAPGSTGPAHLAERMSSQAATAGRTTASLTAANIAHAAANDMLAAFANDDEDAASEASSAPTSQDSSDASFAGAEAGAVSAADPVSFCPRTEASVRDASVSVASMLDTPMPAGQTPAAAADDHATTSAAPRSAPHIAEPRMPSSAAAASGISSLSSAESLPMPSADSASAGRPSRAVRGVPRGWRQTEYAQQMDGWEPGRGLAASTSRNGEVPSAGRRVTRSMARPTYAPALAPHAARRRESAADELSDGAGSDRTAQQATDPAARVRMVAPQLRRRSLTLTAMIELRMTPQRQVLPQTRSHRSLLRQATSAAKTRCQAANSARTGTPRLRSR